MDVLTGCTDCLPVRVEEVRYVIIVIVFTECSGKGKHTLSV